MINLTKKEREEVQATYPDLEFPSPILEPVWYGRRPEFKIEGKKAIVDQKTNDVFGICSDLYQIIYYEDIIRMVELTVKELPEFGKIKVTPRIINNGSKMAIEAIMEETEYEIKKGDFINPKITIQTSYDLNWKLTGKFGAFRLVCSNGLVVGKVFNSFSKRHILSLNPKELKDNILEGMSKYSDQVGLWKKWSQTKLDAESYITVWENLPFSEKEKEKIENLSEISSNLLLSDQKLREQATLWDFHSVVTQYVTHEIKSEIRKAEVEQQVAKIFETVFH